MELFCGKIFKFTKNVQELILNKLHGGTKFWHI
jgi:hypothetical protein